MSQADSIDKVQHRYNFCTIAGKEYLLKAVALHRSLQRNTKRYTLWICCTDHFTYELLSKMRLTNMVLLRVAELEDDRLRELKSSRSPKEYCWTLKPVLIEHVLTAYAVPTVLYCDADLYFFSEAKTIFDEWAHHAVFLCRQRDAAWVEQSYGKFQAGMIGFQNTAAGLESLLWWKQKCLEWCLAAPEPDRFGDQKYLDDLPILFPDVKISLNLGVNAAPWNCIYHNSSSVSVKSNEVYLNNDRLVAFHFACLSVFSEREFDLWSLDPLPLSPLTMEHIYRYYSQELAAVMEKVKSLDPEALSQCTTRDRSNVQTFYRYAETANDRAFNAAVRICTIISREYLIKGLALYESLQKNTASFHIWICCMDETTYGALSKMELKHATLIRAEELEDHALMQVKGSRRLYEYCWTLKAPLCLYILQQVQEINDIVYCDADLYFFSDPQAIYAEWGGASVFICRQRGTEELERLHGKFQAGLIGFKRTAESMRILRWWNDKCVDNCFDIYTDESWGDQKYLDSLPLLSSDVMLSDNIGINAAPWNLVMNNRYAVQATANRVSLDGIELVVFHFGSMLLLSPHSFDLWKLEPLPFDKPVIDLIYLPYIQSLQGVCKDLESLQDIDISIFYANVGGGYAAKNYLQL